LDVGPSILFLVFPPTPFFFLVGCFGLFMVGRVSSPWVLVLIFWHCKHLFEDSWGEDLNFELGFFNF
jgi:hypothetical protein